MSAWILLLERVALGCLRQRYSTIQDCCNRCLGHGRWAVGCKRRQDLIDAVRRRKIQCRARCLGTTSRTCAKADCCGLWWIPHVTMTMRFAQPSLIKSCECNRNEKLLKERKGRKARKKVGGGRKLCKYCLRIAFDCLWYLRPYYEPFRAF